MSVIEKEKFTRICVKYPEIPIFLQDWWLDSIVGSDNWDVFVCEENGSLKAVWPFVYKKNDRKKIIQPPLTQTGGIYYFYPEKSKPVTKISFEKEVGGKLIDRLESEICPKYFSQAFHVGFTNWLPFYWRNFEQSTYYTYRISSIQDIDSVWVSMSTKLRNEIKNSEKKLVIKNIEDPFLLYSMFEKTYNRQNSEPPHQFCLIDTIVNKAIEKGQGRIYAAYSEDGIAQSSIFVINDSKTSFYLLGGSDYSLKNINANAVLLWNAIKEALAEGRSFDFEGSMNEGIEHFFRSFGGEQTPYFRIFKDRTSDVVNLKNAIKPLYHFIKNKIQKNNHAIRGSK